MLIRNAVIFAVMGCAMTPSGAEGAEGSDVDELKREMEVLREDVGELRYILNESVRVDRRRADALERVLRRAQRRGASKQVAARVPGRKKSKVSSDRKSVGTAPASREESARAVGTVSGTVKVPEAEPVAYVYVANVRGRMVRGRSVAIDQSGRQFRPRWAVVEKGTTVKFPNLDKVFHNVFSRSPGNVFDLGLYRKGDRSKGHRFTRSGPVDVYCNIHPEMSASILVVPNKLLAKVKADGTYTIAGVPDGKRKIMAWAPGSKMKSVWVNVKSGKISNADLVLMPRATAHKNKLGRPYGSYP